MLLNTSNAAPELNEVYGAVVFCITTNGDVFIRGSGDIDKLAADGLSRKMILFASKLRRLSRDTSTNYLLN